MSQRILFSVFAVGMGTLVASLDTSVNIAFPDITAYFEIPLPMIQWVVICYLLTFASLMLIFGKLGDMFGHDRVFRFGLLWCVAAFILCGSATHYGWLLVFRVVQGVGCALVIACGPALVTALHPEELRSRALGTYVMMFALGAALGPTLGGALVQAWGWSAVFWFRVPIALAAYLLVRNRPTQAPDSAPQPFDGIGAGLLAMTLSTMLLALNLGLRPGDGQAGALALAGVSLLGLLAFIRRESRFSNPIIDPAHFRNLDFVFVNLSNWLINLVGFAVMLLGPYYLLRVAGFSSLVGGFVLAAGPLGIMVASPLSGWLVQRIGSAHGVGYAGAVLVGGNLLLIGGWDGATTTVAMLVALFLHGFGLGLFQVAYMDMVAGTIPRRDRGVAGSLSMLTRTVGIVSGATTLALVFQGIEREQLANGLGPAESFLVGFQDTFTYAGAVPLILALIALVRFRPWSARHAP